MILKMGMELWLNRWVFFWRIMKVITLAIIQDHYSKG